MVVSLAGLWKSRTFAIPRNPLQALAHASQLAPSVSIVQ
jgi:hypothetical protein